ncbi:MAG: hypothetical protein ACRDLB_09645 [Actinomycetota bacterium]
MSMRFRAAHPPGVLVFVTLALVGVTCDGNGNSVPTSPREPSAHHGASADVGDIMPGLCELRRMVRKRAPNAYDTYSIKVHNPLHELMNDLRDARPAEARSLIRSENRLEIVLLGNPTVEEGLALVRRVQALARRELVRLGHEVSCNKLR